MGNMSFQTLALLTLAISIITSAVPTLPLTCPDFTPTPATPPAQPKNIIIDSDLLSFTDDGAIALANTLQTMGYVNILGIVSDVTSEFSLPGIDAINTWYCHPDIPLTQTSKLTKQTREPTVNPSDPEYVTQLANSTAFPERFDRSKVKDPIDFYTDLLSQAEDQSVTIVAIGFATVLHDFFYSKNGPELIRKKVKELVVQGGSCNTTDKPFSAGYNQIYDLPSAQIFTRWPSPVTFFPGSVADQISAGQTTLNLSKFSPVRYVFDTVNFGDEFQPDDIVTTYYAIFGLGDGSFKYGNENDTGGLQFVPDPSAAVAEKKFSVWNYDITPPAPQRFIVLNQPAQTIAEKLNGILGCYGDKQPVCGD